MQHFWYCLGTVTVAMSIFAAQQESNPYGICSHVTRDEFQNTSKFFPQLQQAGITWVRSDFDWVYLETKPGEWNFKKYDELIQRMETANIQLLPILGCAPRHAYPAHQHLDQWATFVRKVVERYQKQLPVWEVWNEENIASFWKEPNANDYTKLLKRTYETIKAVNPNLRVAFGGTAGVPYEFIENVYKAGGKDCFDIMNIHPYSQPNPPESSLEQRIEKLRELMAKYGDEKKPIWITELGWPTHVPPVPAVHGLATAGLRVANPNRKVWRIGLLQDSRIDSCKVPARFFDASEWPTGSILKPMDADELRVEIGRMGVDAVMLSAGEAFPADLFEDLFSFVKNGGVWFQPGGMPVWNAYVRDEKLNKWVKTDAIAPHECRRRLRIQEEAWWTNKKLPEQLDVKPTEYAKGIEIRNEKAQRFFRPASNMKEGDQFIPLLTGEAKEGYTATAAAVYKYGSDMKGAFITCGIMNMDDRAVNEKQQGEFLSRALLIAMQCRVERFFWYEFQAPEWDDNDGESHFGIVHRDFQPKPAFASYWTLTKCRPASSVTIDGNWKDETVHYYYPQWKLPDGRIAGAVWTLSAPRDYQFTFSDQVTFTNYQGKKLNPKWDMEKRQVVLHLDSGPIYFTGAKLVEAKPLE
ncbi:MAG: cellulase family glycosylhydrolase [Kiritimatiellae bacterium]|nr:cellulase family glycosylhydrolase [Kiritimatiellia bacterium]